jgi:hypothetical protein
MRECFPARAVNPSAAGTLNLATIQGDPTMNRKPLLASALVVLMAGSASFVMAQKAPPPPSATPDKVMTKEVHVIRGDDGGRDVRVLRSDGARDIRMFRNHAEHERGGVIGDLRSLERLYAQAGRSKDMTAVYNDVLSKSQDPRVRDYVYHRLARLQAQPTNVNQAIATLRKALDESLANEAKVRAERESMRATWRQKHAGQAEPAGK